MLPFVLLLFTIQTKLGNKVNLMYNRFIDMWEGNTNTMPSNKYNTKHGNNNIRVLQPLPNYNKHNNNTREHVNQPNTSSQLLPNNIDLTNIPNVSLEENHVSKHNTNLQKEFNNNNNMEYSDNNNNQPTNFKQQSPDFNNMFNVEPLASTNDDNYAAW
jgi:hypothetical protein